MTIPARRLNGRLDIDNAMAQNYLEWGKSLSAKQSYNGAIEKLEIVVNNYVNTTSYAEAYPAAAEAHYSYALSLEKNNNFSAAETQLMLVQTDYINAKVLEDAVKEMPKLLLAWGIDLREDDSYLEAMQN